MKTIAALILLGIGGIAEAQNTNEGKREVVRVYVLKNVDDDTLNLSWARRIASSILAEAGVQIKWPLGEPDRHQQGAPIVINITSDTPNALMPGALACSQVFEGVHVRVFWDRVRKAASRANPLVTFLLGHIMAHEITHIMQGLDRHSEAGLMKGSWTPAEIEQMPVKPLSLAPEDVRLIQLGLLNRAARQFPAAQPDSLTKEACQQLL
jgi:hypothetical protein